MAHMAAVELSREAKPRLGALGLIEKATREARAVARLAMLLPRDLGVALPVGVAPGDDVVVLVHGTLATAGAWRPLRQRLSGLPRAHAASFTYGPTLGVADVSGEIASLLGRLPGTVRVHLVGHSLGGLAVRWFVQEAQGTDDPRIVQTVSLAAPFAGARGARLFPGPAGRDMTAGSAALEQLTRSAHRAVMPHLSVFGTADTAVDAATRFPVGERLVVPGAGHNAILFDDRVTRAVTQRIRDVAR
jgi:pimeloyl-ACP methyl ester carboxylesterase